MREGLSPVTMALFASALVTQVAGASLLPLTRGFLDARWTAACLVLYLGSTWSMAFLLYRGTTLNILAPFMAAGVPIALISIGYLCYGETASPMKLALLTAACLIIGIAASLK